MLLPLKLKQALSSLANLFFSKKIITAPTEQENPVYSVYDVVLNDIDGKLVNMGNYKGRKLLIVNVASECGFTPQYAALQELYEKHKPKIIVLGFPCNDFGKQEKGSNKEIKQFCTANYHVTFPMFEKSSVRGVNKNPLYKWLTDKNLNGWNEVKPSWNFCKYLIDENGSLNSFYSSSVSPLSILE